MRFPTTSQPTPTWDSHLSDDVRAEVATTQKVTWESVTRIEPFVDSLGLSGDFYNPTPGREFSIIQNGDPGDEQP